MQPSHKYPSFTALIFAQFLSALADNAILFIAIAILKNQQTAAWHIPLLQIMFVVPFILFVPFVGLYADSHPKRDVLILGNSIKLIGAILLLTNLSPLFSYGIIGFGAAIYAPAKYGILTELMPNSKLISANSWLESSTIIAILAGVIIGGHLADWSVHLGLFIIAGVYASATIINLAISRTTPRYPLQKTLAIVAIKNCFKSILILFKSAPARASLLGTSIFWGTGSAMRFLLVAWVPFTLGIHNNHTAADLNGVIAIGIILGAILAGRTIKLTNIKKIMPLGFAIGPLLLVMIFLHNLMAAGFIMILLGLCGGIWVIP
ncbi:MAG: lysophospholipid transporter LplT, partial [Pseudomonadota bacterium]|nr:lysophospholipid transporter LplT [Pseudomonadota bacterium]